MYKKNKIFLFFHVILKYVKCCFNEWINYILHEKYVRTFFLFIIEKCRDIIIIFNLNK